MNEPEVKYAHRHQMPFEKFDARGYQDLKVLEFLYGKPWNDVTIGFIHALRPSSIRVILYNKGETLDASLWRVTVHLNEDLTISEISQEVEVGLPDGIEHGEALMEAVVYGRDSEQVKWHQDAESYFMDGINGIYYKRNSEGELIPYPTEENIE